MWTLFVQEKKAAMREKQSEMEAKLEAASEELREKEEQERELQQQSIRYREPEPGTHTHTHTHTLKHEGGPGPLGSWGLPLRRDIDVTKALPFLHSLFHPTHTHTHTLSLNGSDLLVSLCMMSL